MNSDCQFWNDSNQNCDVPRILTRTHRWGTVELLMIFAVPGGPADDMRDERRDEQHGKQDQQEILIEDEGRFRRAGQATGRPDRPGGLAGPRPAGQVSPAVSTSAEPFGTEKTPSAPRTAQVKELRTPRLR